MPSTLTARGEVGKQSKKIERNTRKDGFCAILLFVSCRIVLMFAQGCNDAQLRVVSCLEVFWWPRVSHRQQAGSHIG